jgi:hypothetical protein
MISTVHNSEFRYFTGSQFSFGWETLVEIITNINYSTLKIRNQKEF